MNIDSLLRPSNGNGGAVIRRQSSMRTVIDLKASM